MDNSNNDLALVLSGGGARAAYQVGFLLALARHFPDLNIPILTGVSAGAINAAFLANHRGSFAEATVDLAELWRGLTIDQVFCTGSLSLLKIAARWGLSLILGGHGPTTRGFVDTEPLQQLLQNKMAPGTGKLSGISENLRQGRLKALAITGTNYGTGQAVTWVQGKNIDMWERPHRRSAATEISIAHVMASAALPLFFPAVQVGSAWFGDGGIRQSAPFAPALHLGAERILAVSTRYLRLLDEADTPVSHGYPPATQIIGALLNSVFLDVLDEDARSLNMVNSLLRKTPAQSSPGPVPIALFILRPTCDIGKLCGQYEPDLPKLFRYLGRGLGTHKTQSPDGLSMMMFEPDYLDRMLVIGEADAEARMPEISALLQQKGGLAKT